MKKMLLFFIFATLTLMTVSRCRSSKVTPVKVTPLAMKYVDMFIEDAKFFGVDPSIIRDSIDDIIFYPLHPNILGLYSPPNRQIVINRYVHNDSLVMMKVVYHELGHLYGLPHDTGGIMGTGDSISRLHSIYSNQQNWDLHKAYLFFMIKKHLDKSK